MADVKHGFWVAVLLLTITANAAFSSDSKKLLAQQRDFNTQTLSQGMQGWLRGEASQALRVRDTESVLVVVQVDQVDEALLSRLSGLGVDIRFRSAKYRELILALNSREQVLAVARLPGVRRVSTAEPRVQRIGSVESRAPVALRSQNLPPDGIDGAGQVLGILSDSFARTDAVRDADTQPAAGVPGQLQGSSPQDSGDLPTFVTLLSDGKADGTDEGAAMAELAYDIAPGLDFAFHDVGTSRASFADAIDILCDGNNADIVVDDVGFLAEPYYQDGFVAQAAANCVARGIPYVSAAGNEGDTGYRQIYVDIDPERDDEPGDAENFVPSGVDLHDWNAGDGFVRVRVPAGQEVFAVLQWNQPNARLNSDNGAEIDLDLYATRSDNLAALDPEHPDFVARSVESQGDTGAPLGDAVELLSMTADSGAATDFYLAVEHYRGSQENIPQNADTPLEFRLVFIGPIRDSEYAFNGPTIWGHPMAEGVIGVAAVPWWEAPDFDPEGFGSPAIDPEPFTSRGGNLTVQFDSQGFFAPVTRFTPTLAGVDGNNNTFFGGDFSAGSNPGFGEPDGHPNFFGTSAAAPNIAAAIALIRQAVPGVSPADLVRGLSESAIDVTGNRAETGRDAVTGAGLVDVEATLAFFEANMPSSSSPPAPVPLADSGGGGGGGGCFIATAAYGSYWSKEVRILRAFRDDTLQTFAGGRWLIQQYYRYSPPLADSIRDSAVLRAAVRAALTPVVWLVQAPMLGGVFAVMVFGLLYRRRCRHTPSL